jgi:hypothetical protein
VREKAQSYHMGPRTPSFFRTRFAVVFFSLFSCCYCVCIGRIVVAVAVAVAVAVVVVVVVVGIQVAPVGRL